MDEIMAEQKQQEELQQENEVLDKKQLKAAKKLEKKKKKQSLISAVPHRTNTMMDAVSPDKFQPKVLVVLK